MNIEKTLEVSSKRVRKEVQASIFARLFAFAVDFFIVVIPLHILFLEFGSHLLDVQYYELVKVIVGYLAYLIYCQLFYHYFGATPGKLLVQIQVISEKERTYPGFVRTFVREVLGRVLSDIFLVGYFLAVARPDNRALHDIISGTRVVIKRKRVRKEDCFPNIIKSIVAGVCAISYIYFENTYQDKVVEWANTRYFRPLIDKQINSKMLIPNLALNPSGLSRAKDKDLINQDFLKKAIIKNYKSIKFLPKKYGVSLENSKLFLKQSGGKIEYASPSMMADEKFLSLVKNKVVGIEKDLLKGQRVKQRINRLYDIKEATRKPFALLRIAMSEPQKLLDFPPEVYNDGLLRKLVIKAPKAMLYLPDEVHYSDKFITYFVKRLSVPDLYANKKIKSKSLYTQLLNEKKKASLDRVKQFKANMDDFLKNISEKGHSIRENDLSGIPVELYQDEGFINKLCLSNPRVGEYLPRDTNISEKSGLIIVNHIHSSKKLPTKLVNNIKVNKVIVSNSFYAYNRLSPKLKGNKEITIAAVRKYPAIIQYLPKELINDRDVLNTAIKMWDPMHPYINQARFKPKKALVQYISNDLLVNDINIIKDILKVDAESASFIPKKFLNNKGLKKVIRKSATNHRNSIIQNLKDRSFFELSANNLIMYKNDKEVAFLVASGRTHCKSFKSFAESIRNDKKFIIKALGSRGCMDKLLTDLQMQDKEIMSAAIKASFSNIAKVKGSLISDKDLSILALKEYIGAMDSRYSNYEFHKKYITSTLHTDRDIMALAILANPEFISLVPSDMLKTEPFASKRLSLLEKIKDSFLYKIRNLKRSDITFGKVPMVPKECNKNKKVLLEVLRLAPYLMAGVDKSLIDDKDIVEAVFSGWEVDKDMPRLIEQMLFFTRRQNIKLSTNPLQNLGEKFRSDKKLVLRALNISALSYGDVHYTLKEDPDIKKYKDEYSRIRRRF